MTVRLWVDGIAVEVSDGSSVLDAAIGVGIALPHLCKDPDRASLGTCRSCLVAVDGWSGLVASCTTPAEPDMHVHSTDAVAERVRQTVLQLTVDMLPAPAMADLGELGTIADSRGVVRGRFSPVTYPLERLSRDTSLPTWELDRERCILCQRCVAACQDTQHIYALAMLGRSDSVHVGTAFGASMADSNCTSCGQCQAACPTEAIHLRAASAEPVVRRVETTCPYCGVGCGVNLGLDGQSRIVQVDDVPANPSSVGMLCVKGRYGLEFVHSPERLTQPLIRRRRGGPLAPASWDEALDLVAERLAAHKGQTAFLGSAKTTNEDSYVLQKLARVVMETNNIDHCSRLCHAPSVAGMIEQLGSGSTTNSYVDFERAGCLMVVGSDTDSNHPVIAARIRKGLEDSAAGLIVVNPRRTRLCDVADVWLRPRPGTDVALFNGLAWIVLREGWADEDFITRRTEGFEAWRAAVERYAPSDVAQLTGVTEADLYQAARLYARPARPGSSILWGMGITQHTQGLANVHAMVNLALATGQIGKAGSGLAPLRGQNNVQGCGDAGVLPDGLPGYQGLGEAVRLRFGEAWACDVPAEPGLKLPEMLDAALAGVIKAVYLVGENPMLTEPNLAHAETCLRALDFLVFQGIFMNETAALADVVLPAASFAEKDGTFSNSERRVQLVRKAMEPVGQARADWEITGDLAQRLSVRLGKSPAGFQYQHPREIFAEMASLVPFLGGMSHTRLEEGGLQWPCPTPEHPGSPMRYQDEFPRGRALLIPVEQGPTAAEVPDEAYPLILNTGRVLYHWHGGDISRQVPDLVSLYPEVELSIHPDDAAALGITQRGSVRVSSRRGSMTALANITLAQSSGQVFLPFVRLDDGSANLLTNNAYDPTVKIPEYKVCAVRVEAG